MEFFDPQGGFGNLTFDTNGPNYRVRGVELQVVARITQGLTVLGSGSYNNGQQVNSPSLIDNNSASPGFGKPLAVTNVFGPTGTPLANSPELQANLRLRYDFTVGEYKSFAQVGGSHIGSSNSAVGTVDNYFQPGYTTYDAVGGLRQGCLERAVLCPEPHQRERQHLDELRPVHHDGDRASSAHRRRQVRLQVLTGRPGPV